MNGLSVADARLPGRGQARPRSGGEGGDSSRACHLEAIRRLRGLMSQAQSRQWEAFFTSFFTLGFLTFFGVLPCVPEPAEWGCGVGEERGFLGERLPRFWAAPLARPGARAPTWEGKASYLRLRVRVAGAAAAVRVRGAAMAVALLVESATVRLRAPQVGSLDSRLSRTLESKSPPFHLP